MYPRPPSPRRRLACSPDSFFLMSPEAGEPVYGQSSIPQGAMLDCIPFAFPLPLPIPTTWVVSDSPNQPWWDVGSGHNAGTWFPPPLLAQASPPPPSGALAQWPLAPRAPKSPEVDFPIWDPVQGYWPLAACLRCMLRGSAPVVTSPDQMPPLGLGRASVPPVKVALPVPSSHAIEMPIHLAPSPSESSSVMDISPSGSSETQDCKAAFPSTAPPAPAPEVEGS